MLRRPRRWIVLAAALLSATSSVAACGHGGHDGVSQATFTSAMVERYGASDRQAQCITAYVFHDYDADEIHLLVDEGMGALPQARWGPYLNAAAACITHDQPLEGAP